ncbi:DUF3127 domain-containing protein [Planktotalea sp.]|uniref:DUF3127 domain-containing protein n=1 Tax=Planktotalea sp. TaxID=2029877 RepID=UPI003F6CE31B
MEISGKIIECLPLKSGQSSNGEWRKQEYVLQTDGQYPKKVCFIVWGEKVEQFAIQQGESVEVSVDLESREYNGRWYTDVKAWKVTRNTSSEERVYSISDEMGDPNSSAMLNGDDIPF